jgi:hypothetical protein
MMKTRGVHMTLSPWLILHRRRKGFYYVNRADWPAMKGPKGVQDVAQTEEEAQAKCDQYNIDRRQVDTEGFESYDEFAPEPEEYKRRPCLRCDEVKLLPVKSPICPQCAAINGCCVDEMTYGVHHTGAGYEE